MIALASLWLPILLSAVFVFVASSLIHMVFKWHNSDYRALPNEDEVRDAIRKANPAPGMYVLPYCSEMKDMGSEPMMKKYQEGPVAMLFLKASGAPNIGPALVQWFIFSVGVSLFAAYVASRSLAPGVHCLQVFRIVGSFSFVAYAAGSIPAAIWMGQPWKAACKDMADGLIYALLTAGTFGWLWPH